MTDQLAVLTSEMPIVYDISGESIARLAEQYKDVPQDLSHKDSYEYVRKAVAHLRGLRGDIERRRKELKAAALQYGRLVDSTAKDLTEQVATIEEPLATAKKEYDTAEELRKREEAMREERRLDAINTRIAEIRAYPAAHISSSSAVIGEVVESLLDTDTVWADEFAEKAASTISEVTLQLQELHAMRLGQEQEAVRRQEEERIRQAEEARRAAEEEQRRQREAAELAAEKERLAAERAEMEKVREAEKERLAAERAELERAREEIRAMQEAAAKEQEPAPAAPVQEAPPLLNQAANQAVNQEPNQAPAQPERPASYREAGTAMLAIIGNRPTTKALLDAIIAGNIPFITYIGE